MKRTERHHLKENEFADFVLSARQTLEARRSQVLGVALAVVVIAGAVIGYFAWRSSQESKAGILLAGALAVEDARVGPPAADGRPPTGLSFTTVREKSQAALTKYKDLADRYPSTDAGKFARYQEAKTRMALGVPAEAAKSFQMVIDSAGSSMYGRMARLGLAEAQARSGQVDQAISTFNDVAQRKEADIPTEGVLMQLARTYRDAGRKGEAEQTFNRIVAEYPATAYAAEARTELERLKKKT
jgi:predicted negative regulator of RcsB-dependent stress response